MGEYADDAVDREINGEHWGGGGWFRSTRWRRGREKNYDIECLHCKKRLLHWKEGASGFYLVNASGERHVCATVAEDEFSEINPEEGDG